ncbi:YfcE family phosphodiesterase [Mitsuokella jalaludinii]|uniref:Phosphoesterase n=1 Tax=Mitsuokella jalaludinii TaxID=187979 RepID=A0A173W3J7_9FIRM|nr:metallophosphoesterase [Mitsuokella jalaludinii]CUN34082.1 Putative metallophosphoesterase MG207 homolog [Mitsuokella jalaludinii]
MKIGIVSDSHGSTRAIDRMLSHPAAEGVALWLHAGDITPDAEYLAMVTEGKAKVRYVAGNSDWPEPGARYDDVVEAAGHRIFLTHGHMYGVRFTTKMLCDAAGESGCDIAVYGHTHVAEISTGHITVLNPGSVARPRDVMQGSFLVMELEQGKAPACHLIRFA